MKMQKECGRKDPEGNQNISPHGNSEHTGNSHNRILAEEGAQAIFKTNIS